MQMRAKPSGLFRSKWPFVCCLVVGMYLLIRRIQFDVSRASLGDYGLDYRLYRLAVLPGSTDGKETKHHAHMKAVLKGCEDICRVDIRGQPSLYFDYIEKKVNCHALMTNAAIDAPMEEPEPPQELPPAMVEAFTYGSKVRLIPYQFGVLNQRYMGNKALTSEWTTEAIKTMKHECETGELVGTYDVDSTKQLMGALRRVPIEGAAVLVIGSEMPWIEACALSLGAKEVTTLEYGGIQSTHPQVRTFTPDTLRAFASTFMDRFDIVVSYSSVEHSGLGRYGDALNPWGDRQAMARAWCMTKQGGHLVIGLPFNQTDTIHYNAHREYGPIQLPHLLANWKQLWKSEEGAYQQIWVCQK